MILQVKSSEFEKLFYNEPHANRKHELKMPAGKLRDVKHGQPRSPAHSHCLRPLKATNNKPLNRVRQLSAS